MDKLLQDCLAGKTGSYLLPFFWQHGEAHEALLEELEAIYASGARAFCVESRTHEQFCREAWWEDFGFLLQEAKKRGMQVWLLDDKRFPTGYANGGVLKEKNKGLRQQNLRVAYVDVCGPIQDCALRADRYDPAEEALHSVVAYRRNGRGVSGEPLLLNGKIEDGLLYFDLPEGVWRVYFLIVTSKTAKTEYINMLLPDSCKIMLEEVYEPHYAHFKEYFGNTFAGFFSDEPSFGNAFGYTSLPGEGPALLLPWREDLPARIAQNAGVEESRIEALLPALWDEVEGGTALMRGQYMETVTKLYAENLGWMLGDWCRAHGVLYIGHIIEDMNAHMRLGYGAGHYFRSLDGQDMSGIDVVLNQIVPGNTEYPATAPISGGVADPEFFVYTLAKLGSSHAHIQPLKKNRAMCEIFGAFGWAEGLPMMKHLADHMLVNGINYYVPHAFTAKPGDPDCPPHFYARGRNPQFAQFCELSGYMQRVCHLLSEGIHQASAAVFYNAQGEWSGDDHMLFQRVCKTLTQSQIDFDIVPEDYLGEAVEGGKLRINEEEYGALIVSYSRTLPARLLEHFETLAKKGLPVYFTDSLPVCTSEGGEAKPLLESCKATSLVNLAGALRERGICDICPQEPCERLRFYHLKRQEKDLYLFYNEDVAHPLATELLLPATGDYLRYDPWRNTACRGTVRPDGRLRLHLAQGELAAFFFGCGEGAACYPAESADVSDWLPLEIPFDIACKQGEPGAAYQPYREKSGLMNLAAPGLLPHFCGNIRYTARFSLTEEQARAGTVLDLGRVGETARLTLNGVCLGSRIAPPYRFEVAGALRTGENTLEIEVVSNPGYRDRDGFSFYLPLPPTGLLGPLRIGCI